MLEQTTDPGLAQLAPALAQAAEAAAAALGLPDAPEAGEPVLGIADALGAPASLSAVLPVGGAITGELVLLSAPALDPLLDDRDMGGLTALSNRVRALRAAAESLGCRFGDAAEGDPSDASADVAVPLLVDGTVVAAIALRLPAPEPEPEPEPSVDDVVAEVDAAVDAVASAHAAPASAAAPAAAATEAPAPGFRSSVPSGATGHGPVATRLDQLTHVQMEVTVEIGRTRLSVGELLNLTPGHVVELDRAAGAPVDLFVNGTLLAHGEVVVIDEDFGFRVTEIVGGQG
ncbi:MAG: flagellar motor switch protein FliN [Candidatus Nanopelagicales bacterium]